MNQRIKVYWYQYKHGHGNFGDELNWYIIEKLSGKSVQHALPYDGTRWEKIKIILYYLIKKRWSLSEIYQTEAWRYFWNQKVIYAIGSVISWFESKNVIVWGSGILSKSDKITPAKFLAVRGKYTQQRLSELGIKPPQVLGDPGILLPLVYHKKHKRKFKVGLIPHYIHFEDVTRMVNNSNVLVINLLDPIEKVIDDITCCEITLSTSLHGIIVSHAYRVKSLWVRSAILNPKQLAGDDIKFADYFSSVDIEEYSPFEIDFVDTTSFSNYLNSPYQKLLLPNERILLYRQKMLIKSAPFKVKRKYKQFFSK